MGATLEVEGVTVMDLLQQHPAQDIQVHLAAEAVVVATLVEAEEVVVEATATALLLPRQALPTLHPRAPVQVLTQPQHRAQVPPMDLLLEGVAAYPATEEGVVVMGEVEEAMEVEEDEEVERSDLSLTSHPSLPLSATFPTTSSKVMLTPSSRTCAYAR